MLGKGYPHQGLPLRLVRALAILLLWVASLSLTALPPASADFTWRTGDRSEGVPIQHSISHVSPLHRL